MNKKGTIIGTAAGIITVVACIKIFVPDFDVSLASVDYVDTGDEAIKDDLGEVLIRIEDKTDEGLAETKAASIKAMSIAWCENRITAHGLEVRKSAFARFEELKKRKHSFDGLPKNEVCPILLGE